MSFYFDFRSFHLLRSEEFQDSSKGNISFFTFHEFLRNFSWGYLHLRYELFNVTKCAMSVNAQVVGGKELEGRRACLFCNSTLQSISSITRIDRFSVEIKSRLSTVLISIADAAKAVYADKTAAAEGATVLISIADAAKAVYADKTAAAEGVFAGENIFAWSFGYERLG
ncbi:hypothetical protein RJ640_000020 [Escallonia rubra]|uniref:Uncharacterized protein n=1 Tax=Escallonia rubra TaxID=112253 RepID=A0AA88U2U1_9ASTE|nr:hypothetical protein RJ640_000020 [Escallonia rubra]